VQRSGDESTPGYIAIHDFMSTPYGLVADVKLLNFFRDIGQTAAIVIGFRSPGRWS
jgi:hypothetical protein